MSDIAVAAVLAATILVASMVSVEVGISVALIELLAGVRRRQRVRSSTSRAGSASSASFAGIVLTFLAGAEVDVPQFRREWKASLSIGLVSLLRAVRRRRPARLLRRSAGTTGRPRSAGSRSRRRASPSSTPCSSRPGSTASSSASGSCRRPSSPTSPPSPALTDPLHQADDLDRPVRRSSRSR